MSVIFPRVPCSFYKKDEEIVRTTYKSMRRNEDKELHDNNITQFCSMVNGGLIVQDIHNHGLWGTHEITNGHETYNITSTHHQMQYPYNLNKRDYDILFWADGRSKGYYAGDRINPEEIIKNGEPEIVLYHRKNKPKCLAIQGHPEIMEYGRLHDMLNKLIEKYA